MTMKRETGHSCGIIDRARFEAYAKAGIDCLEISPSQNNGYDNLDFPLIRALADEYGLRLNRNSSSSVLAVPVMPESFLYMRK